MSSSSVCSVPSALHKDKQTKSLAFFPLKLYAMAKDFFRHPQCGIIFLEVPQCNCIVASALRRMRCVSEVHAHSAPLQLLRRKLDLPWYSTHSAEELTSLIVENSEAKTLYEAELLTLVRWEHPVGASL